MTKTSNKKYESYSFIRMLIIEKTFKRAKSENWGDSNVYFVTPSYYDKNREALDRWKDNANNYLCISKFAPEIIWLFNALSPYIDIDFTQKHDVYITVALYVEKNEKLSREKMLNGILDLLTDYETKTEFRSPSIYDWYKYGTEKNDPFFLKFMALWMIFNNMYNANSRGSWRTMLGDYESEREQINNFCDNYSRYLLPISNKLVKSKFVKIFFNQPVYNNNDHDNDDKCEPCHNKLTNSESNLEKIKALLQMIYTVRCNLFHGSKMPNNERDVDLIRCSGEVLQLILEPFYKYDEQ